MTEPRVRRSVLLWAGLGAVVAVAGFGGAYAVGRSTRDTTTVTQRIGLPQARVLVDRVQTLAALGSAGRLPPLATTRASGVRTGGSTSTRRYTSQYTRTYTSVTPTHGTSTHKQTTYGG